MKLIIINGPSGAGKSTLALRLHADTPVSLLIETDVWRRFISGYRENKKESSALSYQLTLAATNAYLQSGNSVIVEKAIMNADNVLDELIALGKSHGAQVHEFILTLDKEAVLKRAAERGYKPGSLLTPEKVSELWEASKQLIADRKEAVVIDTTLLSSDQVYARVKEVLG